MASFHRVSPLEPYAHLSPLPCAPHAPPTSFFSILPPAQYWVGSKDPYALHIIIIIIIIVVVIVDDSL